MSDKNKNAPRGRATVTDLPRKLDVLVVGAGISGIGAAIRLRREGIDSFVVLEKSARPGGTWRDNTYPGCACDVPSLLYSYSFARKPDWSRVFAAQPEILDYVENTLGRFGVEPFIRYEEPALEARWDESLSRWVVRTEKAVYHARVMIGCTGYLHEPIIPSIPGLDDFPGEVFHSSRWNHDHDLKGRKVAVIGTGASAIQFVPAIQPEVAELHIFQRTPQWILPKPDVSAGGVARRVLALPGARKIVERLVWTGFEAFGVGFRRPLILKQVERLARAHLRLSVPDPIRRRALTPDYRLGCKRVLLSNDYYPAVSKPNVSLLPTGVARIEGDTVVGQDGNRRQVNTIILGTGFHVADQPIAHRVKRADGRTLAEVWNGSPEAYRGSVIHGFPNLFLVLGPNLAIGHNSAFIVIEAQLDYAISALRKMRENNLARIEVLPEVQAAYNKKVQRDLQGTVWNTGGCSSYYLDSNGRNSIGFPWSTLTMQRLLRRFDDEHFDVQFEGAGATTEPL